jgi:PleD family two-component response regulator
MLFLHNYFVSLWEANFNLKKMIEILVIGRNVEILQTVVRLVKNNPEWNVTGVSTDDEAIAAFNIQVFKLVLLGGGIEKESEYELCKAFRKKNPGIIIAQHYGGGSGLLTAEIYEALAGKIL